MKPKALPGKPINSRHPIPTLPYNRDWTEDLTGDEFSGMVVIGYYGPGGQWVCQCQCGRYEVRRSKALKKQRPEREYFCSVCEDEISRKPRLDYLGLVAV